MISKSWPPGSVFEKVYRGGFRVRVDPTCEMQTSLDVVCGLPATVLVVSTGGITLEVGTDTSATLWCPEHAALLTETVSRSEREFWEALRDTEPTYAAPGPEKFTDSLVVGLRDALTESQLREAPRPIPESARSWPVPQPMVVDPVTYAAMRPYFDVEFRDDAGEPCRCENCKPDGQNRPAGADRIGRYATGANGPWHIHSPNETVRRIKDFLHRERLGCRLDYRGDFDCDGSDRHMDQARRLFDVITVGVGEP